MNDSRENDSDCSYCREIYRSKDGSRLHELLDTWSDSGYVLAESQNFALLPAIGSCVSGYSLLLPKAHVMSFGFLGESLEEEFVRVVRSTSEQLRSRFNSCHVLIFEHGAKSTSARGGSCMDHAHLHCVPIAAVDPVVRHLKDNFEVKGHQLSLRPLIQKGQEENVPYLAVVSGDEVLVADAKGVAGQYLRRVLLDQLGRPREWDWFLYPGVENMRVTLSSFRRGVAVL